MELISYEDAVALKTLLENETIHPGRWDELTVALKLIIVANDPKTVKPQI